MTGEEYWKLSKGDTVEVIVPVNEDSKVGDILKVEYINAMEGIVYFRDSNKPLGSQICTMRTSEVLDCLEMTNKPVKNNKTITLPFALCDIVWFIVDNEVHKGILKKCNITINQANTQICYNVLYYNRIHCKVKAKGIASNKLFKTKTELLESL